MHTTASPRKQMCITNEKLVNLPGNKECLHCND